MHLLGFPIRREIGLIFLCLFFQSSYFTLWNIFVVVFFVVPTVLFILICGLFIRALVQPRSITYHPDSSQAVIGRPLLFAASVSHVRLAPAKIQFKDRALYIGTPVGLQGRIGGVLSLDEPLPENYPTSLSVYPTWGRVLSWLRAWFSFDPVPYLHRGDYHHSLRKKLDVFLTEQDEDPASWPYAYIMSVPRFLGYSRNVVSWWYLYTPERELGAVIMEIQNSYDEKRSTFIPLKGAEADREIAPQAEPDEGEEAEEKQESNTGQRVRHLSPTSRSKFYQGTFRKEIFASPFEKVGEFVNVRYSDPLQESSWKLGTSLSSTISTGSAGETRMIARVSCARPPLDPTQASWRELASFLCYWTIPDAVIGFTIVYGAIMIHLRGVMRMMSKSAIRPGTIPRHPSSAEMNLECFFRRYLERCVATYPSALEVTYIPSKSISNDVVCMRSPSFLCAEKDAERLTVQPLDPGFYVRTALYSDAWSGLSKELKANGDEADKDTSPLSTSDVSLLKRLLACKVKEPAIVGGITHRPSSLVQRFINRKRGVGFMDAFVLASELQYRQDLYFSSIERGWTANQFFFGYLGLMDFCAFLLRISGRMFSLIIAKHVSLIGFCGISRTAMCAAVYLAIVKVLASIMSV